MDLRHQMGYLGILRRQWVLITSCLLLGVAAAALVTVRTTPVYSSTARLFVSTPTTADANSAAYQGALFSQQRVASYADLVRGTTVAQKVIDKLHLDETATQLSAHISAQAVTNTVILEVTANDPSAERAHLLAQTLAEVFSAYVPQLESATDLSTAPIKAVISDAAVMPTSPVSPRPLVNLGLGVVLGLLVGLGLATLREKLDTTIKTTDALHEITGAASLGIVHYAADAAKRPLVTDLESHSARLESFRVLRTSLQYLDVDAQSKVFTITSPLPGDGKSTTAVNLAITLAQAGQRTLLLEADLRRPRIADYLHLEPTVGLTTLLIGRASLDDVVQPFENAPGLDVITSGALPPNPAELLQSQTMNALLAQLRTRYDIIIVDAPPILPVTDASLLAAATDGAILITHHGKTTKDQMVQSRQRLESVEARLLGTVLNFVPFKGPAGYGYGYGYSYQAGPDAMTTMGKDLRPPVKLVATSGGKLKPSFSANTHSVSPVNDKAQPAAERLVEASRERGAHTRSSEVQAGSGTVNRELPH